MPKVIKGNSRHKPPEPSADHSEVERWCGRLMPDLQPLVRALDEGIREVVPDLQFAVKYRRAFYGLSELGWVIELAPYAVSVNVMFLGGADFESPPPLGTVDRTRYVKLTSIEEARGPELIRWIRQAASTPGWK